MINYNNNPRHGGGIMNEADTIKQILDCHADETISDQQISRLVEPVVRMIREGKFHPPRG